MLQLTVDIDGLRGALWLYGAVTSDSSLQLRHEGMDNFYETRSISGRDAYSRDAALYVHRKGDASPCTVYHMEKKSPKLQPPYDLSNLYIIYNTELPYPNQARKSRRRPGKTENVSRTLVT